MWLCQLRNVSQALTTTSTLVCHHTGASSSHVSPNGQTMMDNRTWNGGEEVEVKWAKRRNIVSSFGPRWVSFLLFLLNGPKSTTTSMTNDHHWPLPRLKCETEGPFSHFLTHNTTTESLTPPSLETQNGGGHFSYFLPTTPPPTPPSLEMRDGGALSPFFLPTTPASGHENASDMFSSPSKVFFFVFFFLFSCFCFLIPTKPGALKKTHQMCFRAPGILVWSIDNLINI